MSFQKTIATSEPEGFIVIDDTRFPHSIGGTRLTKGINQNEVQLLAETMSAKLHTFWIPMSGAKAGINSSDIKDFALFISQKVVRDSLVGKNGYTFITGPDIGTTELEYFEALKQADLTELIRPGLLSQISPTYNLPLDNIITAFGVIVAAEELSRRNKNEDPLSNKRVVIEGFGKVGTGIASLLNGRSKIVGLSTKYGSIQAIGNAGVVENGAFNVEKIIQLKNQYGDKFIFHTGLEVHPTEYLFSVPCDILVPGSRTETINTKTLQSILDAKPSIIVPVANAPYTQEAIERLEASGIICFPDFISSAGAIIAAMIEINGKGGEEEAMNLVYAAISTETRELLLATKACIDPNKPMYQVALDRAKQRKEFLLNTLNREVEMQEVAKNVITMYIGSYY